MVSYSPEALSQLTRLKHNNQRFCLYHVIVVLVDESKDSKSTNFSKQKS